MRLYASRAGRPHSGGSQFFMNVNHNANLDWFSSGASKHPVFGQIIDNYELAVEISKAIDSVVMVWSGQTSPGTTSRAEAYRTHHAYTAHGRAWSRMVAHIVCTT